MYSLPILLVFLLVGVAADRLDRKKIAVNTDIIDRGYFQKLCISPFFCIK
jgi:hypothetical protein